MFSLDMRDVNLMSAQDEVITHFEKKSRHKKNVVKRKQQVRLVMKIMITLSSYHPQLQTVPSIIAHRQLSLPSDRLQSPPTLNVAGDDAV